MTGLASVLVETTREIGGAIGVAAVSTVLISRIGEIHRAADPAARSLATANAFHGAFWVIVIVAAPGCADGRDCVPAAGNTTDRAGVPLSHIPMARESIHGAG